MRRSMSSLKAVSLNPEAQRLRRHVSVDAGDCRVIGDVAPNRPVGLLDGLMRRAGVSALPAPAPVAKKRPRGRPSKQSVIDISSQIWDEVTSGSGVVLIGPVGSGATKADRRAFTANQRLLRKAGR